METGIKFEVIYDDPDVIQLRVSAWNGSFGGMAEIYGGIGGLAATAERLRGFPISISDRREIVFGNFDRKYAGGGIRMLFYCTDGAGHTQVEVAIDSTGGIVQTVMLTMQVEPAAIDTFVEQLQRLETNRSGLAWLSAVD